MTFPGHHPHLFRWRRLSHSQTAANKVRVKNSDVDQWRKRVEMASEFAVSEVFSHKKPHSRTNVRAVPLQSSDQLRDHDDAYGEAQALLGDWLNSKLRLELEMEEEEDDVARSAEMDDHTASARSPASAPNHDTFDDLYKRLAEDEERGAVDSFLQDLMEQELLDSGTMEELALDVGQTRKKFRDPLISMEARHQQVRANRARRDAERRRQQGEREAQRAAREEARKREREAETRRRQEARQEEEMVQQEMARLRRQMEDTRGPGQLMRQRGRQRMEEQRSAGDLQSTPALPTKEQRRDAERLYTEQRVQAFIDTRSLQRLQRSFSGWYSVVLDRRLRLGKAMALSDWREKLKAWRAWRTAVWAEQKHREVARTQEELRTENRRCQLAMESDRRRLLRQCLDEWQRWCRTEREQRELLAQQRETRRKMAALISAASTGKLKATGNPPSQTITPPPEAPSPQTTTDKEVDRRSGTLTPDTPVLHQDKVPAAAAAPRPTQPWQVTRRHAAPTAAELQDARRRVEAGAFACPNRHAVQQQIIAQQRKLLKEQQEQIARLRGEQAVMGLELETQKSNSRPKSHSFGDTELRAGSGTAEAHSRRRTPPRTAATRQICPHPIIAAMEARARERAQRRQEIEEVKRKREEQKLAEMKSAEEQRQREEEEEKRQAAEKRKEDKRLEREREEEKQRQLKRQQELLKLARQHYHRALLLRRGLVPWKRLIHLRQANMQLAESHRNLVLLKWCTLGWQQSARESLSEREASADQLHQHFLLRRSLSCWKRLQDWRVIQEERAERFCRTRTLRKCLRALLNHVTRERLVGWDKQKLAQEHSDRRVLRQCLLAWRQLPCVLRQEREKEVRRERLVRKVAEVLPDFSVKPPEGSAAVRDELHT